MFIFDIESHLDRKLKKIAKKDKILFKIFQKKVIEIISHTKETINTYKNLKSPLNNYKRIHLTDNFILLFKVNLKENKILFVDIKHWDDAYI